MTDSLEFETFKRRLIQYSYQVMMTGHFVSYEDGFNITIHLGFGQINRLPDASQIA